MADILRNWTLVALSGAAVLTAGALALTRSAPDNSTELTKQDFAQLADRNSIANWTSMQLKKYERLTPTFEIMARRFERLSATDCEKKTAHYFVVTDAATLAGLGDILLAISPQEKHPLPNRERLPRFEKMAETIERYGNSLEAVCTRSQGLMI